jgi:hypothetical protein
MSTFLQYLHHLQTIIVPSLIVQDTPSHQSSGTVTDVSGKVYPRVLRRWDDFPGLHNRQFDDFVKAFGDEQLFPSLIAVKITEEELSSDAPNDEQDIRSFIRTYAERPAMRMVNMLDARRQPPRGIKIRFRSNAYGLHPKEEGSQPPSKKRSPDRIGGLAPDRWGLRVAQDGTRMTALVGEYKAAHKAPAKSFRAVLGTAQSFPGTLFADCTRSSEAILPRTETEPQAELGEAAAVVPTPTARPPSSQSRTVAKVLCQAYHYMIISGLAYGYVASGQCMVFLAVLPDDPSTLFVHLVDESPGVSDPRRSHAAQLATLAVLALEAEIPPAQWILHAELSLPRWPSRTGKKGDKPDAVTGVDAPSLPPDDDPSPLPRPGSSCGVAPTKGNRRGEDGDDDHTGSGYGPGAHTQVVAIKRKREQPGSSRDGGGASDGKATPRQGDRTNAAAGYCTQACLLGLCRDGSLDPACPNTPAHSGQGRWTRHPVSVSEVCRHARDRLARNLDYGCECLDKYGMFGATGVLFRMTDPTYGYTFVAKGVQEIDADTLAHEARVYSYCSELQGTRIPVYLGAIDLVYPYPLRSMATVSHMMFLSWAGPTLTATTAASASVDVEAEINAAIEALDRYGIEHDDVREANLAWNDEAGGVMVIDFDQAFFVSTPAKRARKTDTPRSEMYIF